MNISENLKKNLRKILIEDEIEAISVVNPEQFEKNIENFEKILEENITQNAHFSFDGTPFSLKFLSGSVVENVKDEP